MMTAHLVPNEETIKDAEDDEFALVSYFDIEFYATMVSLFL